MVDPGHEPSNLALKFDLFINFSYHYANDVKQKICIRIYPCENLMYDEDGTSNKCRKNEQLN
jgi:hypothetical protein